MATFAYQITEFAYQGLDELTYQGVERISGSGVLLAANGSILGEGTVSGTGTGSGTTRRASLDMDIDGVVFTR